MERDTGLEPATSSGACAMAGFATTAHEDWAERLGSDIVEAPAGVLRPMYFWSPCGPFEKLVRAPSLRSAWHNRLSPSSHSDGEHEKESHRIFQASFARRRKEGLPCNSDIGAMPGW